MDKIDKKIFATLLFSVFANVTGVGIVVPLLPIYAHELGASGFYIGLIFGSFSLSRTLFMPYFGRLSDRKGRKPFIIPGLLGYAIISIAFIYSNNVTTLIIIRFFHGVASAMLMPVIQAYVADITPKGREGFAMGLFNMFMLFGLSLGPLIGGLIKDQFNFQTSFLCMGMLALLAFVFCLFLLPPKISEGVIRSPKEPVPWRQFLFDRTIAGLLVFRFAYVVCIGIIWAFVPLYADVKFSLSSSSIGIVIMLGVLISGSINVPMGFVADRINKKIMVVIGGMIVGYAILSFTWVENFSDMGLAAIIFGIGGGVSMPALMAMAALKGNTSGSMGSVMALMNVAHSLGMLTGALIGGLMMDVYKLQWAFPTGAFIMIICSGVFLISTYRQKAAAPAKFD
jgi:multidrug resistance protein